LEFLGLLPLTFIVAQQLLDFIALLSPILIPPSSSVKRYQEDALSESSILPMGICG
jgi:hypothetical protein